MYAKIPGGILEIRDMETETLRCVLERVLQVSDVAHTRLEVLLGLRPFLGAPNWTATADGAVAEAWRLGDGRALVAVFSGGQVAIYVAPWPLRFKRRTAAAVREGR